MTNSKKISIRVPEHILQQIDEAVEKIPNMTRSEFMIKSALLNISNNEEHTNALVNVNKEKIMCHLTNLSNLTNELKSENAKKEIREEVLGLWQSLN